MKTMQLKDVALSAEMLDANQISLYTEPTFIHISGDNDIGNLYLSGNFNVGNNMVGSYCLKIKSIDRMTNIISVDSTDGISTAKYSFQAYNNYDLVGNVVSVISQTELSVDVIPDFVSPSEDQQEVDNGNAYLWQPGNPNIGLMTSEHKIGKYSTAIGTGNYACHIASYAEGKNTIAAGKYSHSEGINTKAGYAAHADGQNTIASGVGSHASGINANSQHEYSYVWNGDKTNSISSNGNGSFTVNPQGGMSGFYIGNTSLKSVIDGITDLVDKLWIYNLYVYNDNQKEYVVPQNLTATTYVYDGSQETNDIKEATISKNYLSINSSAGFVYSGSLQKINIGNITLIDSDTFAYCGKLENISSLNQIRINSSAFRNSGLKNIMLPNITRIGGWAFYSCQSLMSVDFSLRASSTIPELPNTTAFENTSEQLKIIVPDSMYSDWINASGWNMLSDKIVKASDV